MPTTTEEITNIAKYVDYFGQVSTVQTNDSSPYAKMIIGATEQFKLFGLTNEEKANALVALYTNALSLVTSETSKAALALIQADEATELNDKNMEKIDKDMEKTDKDMEKTDKDICLIEAQCLKTEADTILSDNKSETEIRKARGYDDNMLIEIMRAQGGLASFAVNANSDTAQDTIDDLHDVMATVEDRTCDYICDTPVFILEVFTTVLLPIIKAVLSKIYLLVVFTMVQMLTIRVALPKAFLLVVFTMALMQTTKAALPKMFLLVVFTMALMLITKVAPQKIFIQEDFSTVQSLLLKLAILIFKPLIMKFALEMTYKLMLTKATP